MKKKSEELCSRVEAEQSVILNLIEESKRLAARSDVLMNAAKRKKSRESEGELEDA